MSTRDRRDDRGAITAFVTVFTVAVIFVFGLLWDGGRMLAAQRQADNEAAAAARAAAQALADPHATGQITNRLDPTEARRRVCDYFRALDRGCGAATVDVDGARVTVRVNIDVDLLVLPLASRTARGEGTACSELGITDEFPAGGEILPC